MRSADLTSLAGLHGFSITVKPLDDPETRDLPENVSPGGGRGSGQRHEYKQKRSHYVGYEDDRRGMKIADGLEGPCISDVSPVIGRDGKRNETRLSSGSWNTAAEKRREKHRS